MICIIFIVTLLLIITLVSIMVMKAIILNLTIHHLLFTHLNHSFQKLAFLSFNEAPLIITMIISIIIILAISTIIIKNCLS